MNMVSLNMGAQAGAPGISRAQIYHFTREKKDLWQAMVTNGYMIQALKSQIVTLEWMEQVHQKLVWCPKKDDLREQALVA